MHPCIRFELRTIDSLMIAAVGAGLRVGGGVDKSVYLLFADKLETFVLFHRSWRRRVVLTVALLAHLPD